MENDTSTFTNEAKPTTSLPGFEGMEMEPIQPDYLKVLLMQKGLQFVFISLLWSVVLFIDRDFAIFPGLLAAGILLFLLGISTFMTIIVFPTRKFLLREHDISYERGRIFYSMTTVPLNRIQHVSLGQGRWKNYSIWLICKFSRRAVLRQIWYCQVCCIIPPKKSSSNYYIT